MHIHAYISTSAKHRTNLPQLCDLLVSCASLADTGCDIIVSNLRHYEALTRALEANFPTDLVAMLPTANADDFTLHEVRQLARAAAKSGVMVTITNGNAFTPQELKIIASDGKGHISFVDLKIGLH